MRKLIALIIALILPFMVMSQTYLDHERNIGEHTFLIDSTDGVGIWPAAGDTVWHWMPPEKFQGTDIHGFFKIDSLECEASSVLLDNWSLKYRRGYSDIRADSLQESDATGHEWRFAKIVNDGSTADFDGLRIAENIWIEFWAEFNGIRPRSIDWFVDHITAITGASDTIDSAKVWIEIDGYK